MSVFDRPGLYLRAPDGGVEDVQRMKDNGFASIAINVGDFPLPRWDLVRQRAANAGVVVLPWARCRTDQDVTALVQTAKHMGGATAPVLVNAEDELQLDGPVTERHVASECRGMDACVSTLPWTVGIDIAALSSMRIHLQMFPQENDSSTRPRDCRAQAYDSGAKWAHFMHGIHDIEPNVLPPLQGPYWVYTADDAANDFRKWGPKDYPPLSVGYQGPLYPVGHPKHKPNFRPYAVRALKVACHRAGFLNFHQPVPDPSYGPRLKLAIQNLQRAHDIRPTGYYGPTVHTCLMTLQAAHPGEGYALTEAARLWLAL